MARFDVYANPGSHAATTPYLLDVQSDLLDGLDTRVVIPLRRLQTFPKVKLSARLTPVVTIAGETLLLETPKMGAVPQRVLYTPVDLARQRTGAYLRRNGLFVSRLLIHRTLVMLIVLAVLLPIMELHQLAR